ncbi:MAG: hypothetical protein IJ794_07375 [Lachnospiraceae bacterium]|nr:hypothetical protein [Lachnospiraceae bacterium]MBQ8117130.1 hypothetical protein [Lachnospiraceae bacterium]MBR1852946.1 hypothetical protein [Lachnospiraceae bacterium]
MDIDQIKNNLPEKIQEVVTKVSADKTLLEQFQKEPVKVVEKVVGVDLPDDVVNRIIDGVKAKLTADKISGVAGSVAGAIKNLL